jgi:hypothetical protein
MCASDADWLPFWRERPNTHRRLPGRVRGGGSGREVMARCPCPICGDPNAFPFWLENEPPPTCPQDPAWPRKSLNGICQYQIRKAEQAAALRKITPDAFDAYGVMIPSESGRAWRNYIAGNPGKSVVV